MGGKFGSINIKGTITSVPLLSNATVCEIVHGWTTVACDDFGWGTTHKIAQNISKMIKETVLSTEYYDDDYAEFILFRNGKRIAIHIPTEYEGFTRRVGNPKSFSYALSMAPGDEKLFRIVFAETDPSTSVKLMESLLGCPIDVRADTLETITPPVHTYLDIYHEQKNAKRIKNQTRFILNDEKDLYFGWHPTYPIVHRACGKSYRNDNNPQELYVIDDEGKLHRLFEIDISGYLNENFGFSYGYGITTLQYKDFGENPLQWLYIFSDDGILLDKKELKFCDGLSHTKPVILDNSHIYLGGMRYNFRERTVEWIGELTSQMSEEEMWYKDITFSDLLPSTDLVIQTAILPGVGPVLHVGNSGIVVMNKELQIISRHNAKGWIRHFIPKGDRLFIISYRQEKTTSRWENGKFNMGVIIKVW